MITTSGSSGTCLLVHKLLLLNVLIFDTVPTNKQAAASVYAYYRDDML